MLKYVFLTIMTGTLIGTSIASSIHVEPWKYFTAVEVEAGTENIISALLIGGQEGDVVEFTSSNWHVASIQTFSGEVTFQSPGFVKICAIARLFSRKRKPQGQFSDIGLGHLYHIEIPLTGPGRSWVEVYPTVEKCTWYHVKERPGSNVGAVAYLTFKDNL